MYDVDDLQDENQADEREDQDTLDWEDGLPHARPADQREADDVVRWSPWTSTAGAGTVDASLWFG